MPQAEPHCLILIDLQTGFRHPKWGARGNPGLEANVSSCLAAARAAGLPVIHVRHAFLEPSSPLRAAAPGFAFIPEAAPAPGELVLTKSAHGAFVGTELEAFLRGRKLEAPVFLGLAADHCVSTSVRMANDLGFAPLLVADATAAFPRRLPEGNWLGAEEVQAAALASLEGEFARLISTKNFVESLGSQL